MWLANHRLKALKSREVKEEDLAEALCTVP